MEVETLTGVSLNWTVADHPHDRPRMVEGFAASANLHPPHMNPTGNERPAEDGQVPDKPIGTSGRTTTIKARMLTERMCQQHAIMRSWELKGVWVVYVFVLAVLSPFAKRGVRSISHNSA